MGFNFSDEEHKLSHILGKLDPQSRVLDIGCGHGRNLDLARNIGFQNLYGVDVNIRSVDLVKDKGFTAFQVDEFKKQESEFRKNKFDVLIMSQIIEHFDYISLKDFIDYYLSFLRHNGLLIIATPVMQKKFYNDFDHVRPYLPISIDLVYGRENSQVQLKSDNILKLEDLYFYRQQFSIVYASSLYLRSFSIAHLCNRFFKYLFYFTRGYCGETVGWVGLYRKISD